VALDVHKVPERRHDLLRLLGELPRGAEDEDLDVATVLAQQLKGGNREDRGLSGPRLRLRNNIAPDADGTDRPLLDGGRLLEPVRVYSLEKIRLEIHAVKGGTGGQRRIVAMAAMRMRGASSFPVFGPLPGIVSAVAMLRLWVMLVAAVVAVSLMIAIVLVLVGAFPVLLRFAALAGLDGWGALPLRAGFAAIFFGVNHPSTLCLLTRVEKRCPLLMADSVAVVF
jgi:hypothetical protein